MAAAWWLFFCPIVCRVWVVADQQLAGLLPALVAADAIRDVECLDVLPGEQGPNVRVIVDADQHRPLRLPHHIM